MSDSNHHNHIHSTSGTGISSVFLGMAVGAVITYLFANKEGQKIRDQILKEGIRLLDEVSEKAQELQEKAQTTEQEVGRQLAEKIEDVKKGVEEIEQMANVPEHIEQIQKKGRRFFFRKSHTAES